MLIFNSSWVSVCLATPEFLLTQCFVRGVCAQPNARLKSILFSNIATLDEISVFEGPVEGCGTHLGSLINSRSMCRRTGMPRRIS